MKRGANDTQNSERGHPALLRDTHMMGKVNTELSESSLTGVDGGAHALLPTRSRQRRRFRDLFAKRALAGALAMGIMLWGDAYRACGLPSEYFLHLCNCGISTRQILPGNSDHLGDMAIFGPEHAPGFVKH